MKLLLDSSVFLKLLLDEPGAEKAQEILENIEECKVCGYVTPLILEEVAFKLVFAKASEQLKTRNIWRIRESLKFDEKLRSTCIEELEKFSRYIEYMLTKGLRAEYVTYDDWKTSIEVARKYGLLPADALHVAVAMRIGANAIASFDENFKRVKEVKTVP
ncbi:MAG: hypothetical protein DRN68_07820 [Thaumarchaeota archaeon]|nr:MAG: hypothetical protein DRN68_07820 [Nitrososphaerota archaeon]